MANRNMAGCAMRTVCRVVDRPLVGHPPSSGRLMVLACIVCSLLACGAQAMAMLVAYPLDQRVADANLIVVGVLERVAARPAGTNELVQGRLVAGEVLWGPGRRGSVFIVRRVQKPRARWRLSTDYEYGDIREWAGKRVLWFLTRSKDGSWCVDHPAQMADVSERGETLRLLRGRPISIRVREWSGMRAQLVFRNVSGRPMRIPAFRSKGGRLLVAPGVSVTMRLDGGRRAPVRARAIGALPAGAQIAVPPHSEYSVPLNCAAVFATGREYEGWVVFAIRGFPRAERWVPLQG